MTSETKTPIFKLGVRQKVVIILVTVLLSTLTVSSWLALEQEKKNALQEIHQRGSDITRFVSESLAYSVVGYDYHTIQLLLDEITSSDIVAYAKVTSSNGNVMAKAGSLKRIDSSELVMFDKDIKLNSEPVGALTIAISTASTLQRLDSEKYNFLSREMLVILLIAIGEFSALSYFIIRPVRVMSEAARDKAGEDGRRLGKFPIISNDEFGDLAKQFNALCSELNEANDQLHTRFNSADEQLRETNKKLMKQSEELQEMSKEFERLSITDALTGLYNRRHFEASIESTISASIRYSRTSSLLLVDVDHFKDINDTHGHAAGDTVLKEMARRLKTKMRGSDTLFRIGGEEFGVICENAGQNDALNIAEKLRTAVCEVGFDVGAERIKVSVSVGIATIPDSYGTATAKDFYRCADVALYESKRAGRDCVTHYTSCAPVDET